MKKCRWAAVAIGWLCFVQAFSQRDPVSDKQGADVIYDYSYINTVVKGGEGFGLVTEIYLPKGEGPWPVIITRTPYVNKKERSDDNESARRYARKGIGFIRQRCRGTGGSEGTYIPNIYEREDGLALVNWVANRKWCGSIGLVGVSYSALTCWIVADSLPDKVKGIYLEHYGIDRHLSAYKDGLFRQDILTSWAIDNASEIKNKPFRDKDEPYYDQYRFMPQIEMDIKMLGTELKWYRDWITRPDYVDPYWSSGVWGQLKNNPAKIRVPVTIVAGLFDHHLEGTVLGYELLPDSTKRKSRLIVGAWDHFYQVTPDIHRPQHVGDVNIAKDRFDWFYRLLVEEDVPEGNVQMYFIGADKWICQEQWPVKPDGELSFYLTDKPDKEMEKAYSLSLGRKAGESKLSFVYDPDNPVFSVGGETLFASSGRRGSKLQPEIGYREDVLFFLSEPLKKPLAIAGPIKAVIYMSSDVEDTSITFKVSEVFLDGSAYNIRTGITALAYRNDRWGKRKTYKPNERIALEIETLPITWEIKPGNRLRVDITSSDFPEYNIHSNYPGIWSCQTQTKQAFQTIFLGKEYPSRIIIPYLDLKKRVGQRNN